MASLCSALAASPGALFIARAGQGLGAALLSPAALSIITAEFKGPERVRALGVWGAIGGAGAAVGVLIGGLLTQLIDWRAIFFINLPIGLYVAVGAARALPAERAPTDWRRLDLTGAVLVTISVGSLVFAFSQAQSAGWASARTIGLIAAALVGLVMFAVWERHVLLPLFRIERLADRAIGGGFVMMLAAAAVLFGSFLLSSVYLQQVLGADALATGIGFLPLALAIGAGVHAGTHVIRQRGVRAPLAGGFAITAVGMFLLTGVDTHGSYFGDLLPGMLVAGAGLGVAIVSVAFSVLSGARADEAGMLSGLNTTGHEVGGSLGLAVLTTIAIAPLGHARGPATIALANGISNGFLAAAVIAVAAALAALMILPSAKSFLPKLELAQPMTIH
jgi:hypothetical protein